MPVTSVAPPWLPVGSVPPATLTDARLQLHHAAQLIVSTGISYLPARADDSHTNLEWLPASAALAANILSTTDGFRFALRTADLTLLALSGNEVVLDSFGLFGQTVKDADSWMRKVLAGAGYDADRLTQKKHYAIPVHAVAGGAPFTSQRPQFQELGRYYHDAWFLASSIQADYEGASEPRCWPHHFDLATLITLPGQVRRTIGVGITPGDQYYQEPYIYIGPYPYPPVGSLGALPIGHWHTNEWTGAVLTASEFGGEAGGERALMFARAAVAACERAFAAG